MILPTFLVVIFLISTAFAMPQIAKASRQKMKEAAMVLMTECKEKAGATDDDIKSLKDRKMPTTRTGQCMIECFLDKAKIMRNGRFDKLGAIEASMVAVKGDLTKITKVRQLMNVCDTEIINSKENDKCKIAKRIVECTVKHGKDYGFEMPKET